MHDAVAATEVVCYASRKLVENAMHCRQQTTDPEGMRLDRSFVLYCCCQSVLETVERNESDESGNTRNNPFIWFLTLDG